MSALEWGFLILPLVAWALMARTWLTGLLVAAALVAVDVGWILFERGAIGQDSPTTLMLALMAILPVVLVVGWIVTERNAGVQPGLLFRVRRIAGQVLCIIIAGVSVAALAGLWMVMSTQDNHHTPPSSDVLPLQAGLTVVSDVDQGCQGTGDFCTREVDITGTPGLSPAQTQQLVLTGLARSHGWVVKRTGDLACRSEGWWYDQQNVCVRVEDGYPVKVVVGNDLGG